jgi:hypothetical protein
VGWCLLLPTDTTASIDGPERRRECKKSCVYVLTNSEKMACPMKTNEATEESSLSCCVNTTEIRLRRVNRRPTVAVASQLRLDPGEDSAGFQAGYS